MTGILGGQNKRCPFHRHRLDVPSSLVARMKARISTVASMMCLRWTRSDCTDEYHVEKQNVEAQLDDRVDVHHSPLKDTAGLGAPKRNHTQDLSDTRHGSPP